MKFFLIVVAVVLGLAAGLWIVALPEDVLVRQAEKALEGRNLSLEMTDLKKGLFYNFTVGHAAVKKSSELLFSVDNLSGRINPFSLFLIRLPLTFEGEAGGGRFSGRVELLRGKGETDIKVDGMSMEKVPFFEEIGMGGSGTLAGTLKMLGGTGSMKFSIKDLRFDSGTLFGIPIAPDMFRIARAALTIQGGVLRIDSFSLEGSGVYARIKGNIAGGKPDLTLEIMSDSPAADLAPSLALLDNYRISPGYYVIPVKELPTAK